MDKQTYKNNSINKCSRNKITTTTLWHVTAIMCEVWYTVLYLTETRNDCCFSSAFSLSCSRDLLSIWLNKLCTMINTFTKLVSDDVQRRNERQDLGKTNHYLGSRRGDVIGVILVPVCLSVCLSVTRIMGKWFSWIIVGLWTTAIKRNS